MSVKQPKTIAKQHFCGSQITFRFFIKHVLLAPQGALVVMFSEILLKVMIFDF